MNELSFCVYRYQVTSGLLAFLCEYISSFFFFLSQVIELSRIFKIR